MSEDSVKLIINLISRLVAVGVILALIFGVRALFNGSEYCIAEGCPKEAFPGADYCYYHKCSNTNCENPKLAQGLDYCEECLERAGY